MMKTMIQCLLTLAVAAILIFPPWAEPIPTRPGQRSIGHRALWHGQGCRLDLAVLGSELAVLALVACGLELGNGVDELEIAG